MNLFRALKLVEPGGSLKRVDWPSCLFIYVTPKTEVIMIQLFKGFTSYAGDQLSGADFKAKDWLIIN